MSEYQVGTPLPGYTEQPPPMRSLNEMYAALEAYRAVHGPVLRELRCQQPVREHLVDLLSTGEPLPLFPPMSTGVPLIDDADVPAGLLRLVYDDGTTVEHRVHAQAATMTLSEWVNSLLPPEVAAAGLHWEWSATDGPDETLDAANRHADERIAEWRYRMAQVPPGYDGVIGSLEGVYDANTQIITDDGPLLYWGEALTPADSNTPHAGSMTCAHICGPDPDHACDARAVTFLEHQNLAGGVTRMPVCGPCGASEKTAEAEHA